MLHRFSRTRRKQVYVHRMQKTYAVGLGLTLFIFSLVVFALAFIIPYLVPAIKLLLAEPLEEQGTAATQMLYQVQTVWPTLLGIAANVWPALLALILAAAPFSFYLTHRLAGPLYNIQRSTSELAQGNLSLRIKLRKGDYLQDLAELTNQAIGNIEQAMIEIRDRDARSREAIHAALEDLKAENAVDATKLGGLEAAVAQSQQQIEDILKRFQFTKPAA